MTHTVLIDPNATEDGLRRLAARIALKLKAGDSLALRGDLGAGKTTFARALIRAVLDDVDAEVPSPTFSLLQSYEGLRLHLAHLDLYRLADASEADELGVSDFLRSGAIIVEWPDRAPDILGTDRLEIALSAGETDETRRVEISAFGSWGPRLQRLTEMIAFLGGAPDWLGAETRYLQGDASARAYARLALSPTSRVLMDAPRLPDGPPIRNGLPYSRFAHLAEDVTPFVAVAEALRRAGLSVPEIYLADLDRGFLLLEDFGDRVFGRELAAGVSQAELWGAATDALCQLHRTGVPDVLEIAGGGRHTVPHQDRGVLGIEVELLVDWYWPALLGSPIPDDVRAEFLQLWSATFDRLLALPAGWVLRDFHSPNLMWLPDRTGAARAGIIDFQDALAGPPAYDVVSLLQDARVDVPPDIETVMLARYCDAAMTDHANFDRDTFQFSYAALGAQRNTKILGIFARLARRDGKSAYLRHIPRIWRYLERDLQHPELLVLRQWYDRYLPPDARSRNLEA